MNRRYKKADFLKIIKEFKKEIPNISIATDIIVAYPTETEEDFQQSMKILKEIKPDMLNLSSFWSMKGTPAHSLKQLPRETAKKRTTEMMQEFRKIADENNRARIGKISNCLVYDCFKNNYISHSEDYKLVVLKSNKNILGKIVKIKITNLEQLHLVGDIV
jgi:tRNA A37 methylthiotransferase MiaB